MAHPNLPGPDQVNDGPFGLGNLLSSILKRNSSYLIQLQYFMHLGALRPSVAAFQVLK